MKKIILVVLCIVLSVCFSFLYAQVEVLTVDDVIERLNDNGDEAGVLEDDLHRLAQSPLQLNKVTRKELERLPFLSEIQIVDFLAYRDEHRGLLSIYDLKLIDNWDLGTIQLLLPFVRLGDYEPDSPSVRGLFHEPDQELFLRMGRCLNMKQGYRHVPDSILTVSPNKRYLGGAWQHSVRYRLSASEHLQFGLVGEQDAGEPFMSKHYNKYGYDYYSIYLWAGNWKRLKSAVIGNYKLSVGQGMVINQSFSVGKSFPASYTGTLSRMIRPHYSSSENDYLQGAAATFSLWGGEYSLFYSYRKLDAFGNEHAVTSFKEDGYHRTVGDWEKRDRVTMQMAGGRIYYELSKGEIGLTGLTYYFDKPVQPSERPYNRYYFRGRNNYNLGIDFRWHWRMLHWFGECAMSKNRALAGIVSLQIPFSGRLYLLTSYRNYSKRYHAYYASPFAETSACNEQGVFLAMEYKPVYPLSIQASIDYFRHPFMRYGVNAPSDGTDLRLKINYTRDHWNFLTDYRFRRKERNKDSNTALLQTQYGHMLKMQWNCTLAQWRLKTTASLRYRKNDLEKDTGGLLAQTVQWQLPALPLQLSATAALFNASDYDVRVWFYDYNGPYASSSNSFYGKGGRVSAGAKYTFRGRLTLYARYSVICYADRDYIGTGLEQIEGSIKNDLSFYLLFRF